MKINIKSADIYIDPLMPVILIIMYIAGYLLEFLTVLAAVFLHEFAHMICALLHGRRIYSVRILPVGLNATFDEDSCDRRSRLFIYLSGPCANIILFISGSLISLYYSETPNSMRFFISANLYLALFNLLPVIPLDGGKVLRDILSGGLGFLLAGRYIRRVTVILSILIILLGIVQIAGNSHNFSLILIGFYILFVTKNQEMEAALMNVKDIIYRRSRLLKKGIYPVRELVALKSMQLGDLLKNLDFDRFHIIYILDDSLKILAVYTEQELMDGMLKNNVDISLEEFMKNEKIV